jgi:hypothetical protein
MTKQQRLLGTLAAAVVVLGLGGCGSHGALGAPKLAGVVATQSVKLAAGVENMLRVPGPADFTTIQATVKQLMPDTNHGLPHQNFVVIETAPTAGVVLEVNNDEKFGTRVPNLAVGEALVIKGILYHDPAKDGIHWTHHTNTLGDAGFIQTPDGQLFQ